MASIDELISKLKEEEGQREEAIYHWACDLAKAAAKRLLEEMDKALMKVKEVGLIPSPPSYLPRRGQ